MFDLLTTSTPERFKEFAEDYYEIPVNIAAVRRLYDLRPLDRETVRALNSTVSLSIVADAAAEIGYATDWSA
ncbi:hypothetical protein [Streptomyces sp. NPDC004008]